MFYREVNFKDTEIERIPKDWEVSKLEKICEKIKAGGTPLTTKKEFWNGNIPFVKIEDMTSSGKYLMKTSSSITKVGLENSNAWLVPENSLLLAMYGSLGEVSINKINVATNQAILGIIPKEKDDVEFLYYWFLYFKPCWRKFAKPTTQANLTAEIVRNSTLPLPSPQERRKIVEILSTVDEAIQKTNEIIAKTARLKKGLMQELLTKGIGHKEFKDTEIGRIPSRWEVIKLSDKTQVKEGFYGKRSAEGTIIQLKADSIGDNGRINPGAYALISVKKDVSEYFLRPGDILMSNRNSEDLVGKVAIFKGEFNQCVFSNLLTRIRVCSTDLLPEWLLYILIKMWDDGALRALSTRAVNQVLLKKGTVEKLKIPLPPLDEQQKIVKILLAVDEKLEIERKEKAKLEIIKQGLMSLFLTGKIRVKI
jgi:type I restriction enzyme S subunit